VNPLTLLIAYTKGAQMKYKVVYYSNLEKDCEHSDDAYTFENACAIASALSLDLVPRGEVCFTASPISRYTNDYYSGYYIVKEDLNEI